mmetsp:Transcript_19852/g.62178  ORF Transcript_19852/g.62178 Transcript_19852/m.62178 type:complete len:237 (+) Transcript_19852:4749-5459(+)
MRFELQNVDNDDVELVITVASGTYEVADDYASFQGMNGDFGVINVKDDTTVHLNFAFEDSNGDPVALNNFVFSMVDIDQHKADKHGESLCVASDAFDTYLRCADIPQTGRSDTVAATWIFRRDVEIRSRPAHAAGTSWSTRRRSTSRNLRRQLATGPPARRSRSSRRWQGSRATTRRTPRNVPARESGRAPPDKDLAWSAATIISGQRPSTGSCQQSRARTARSAPATPTWSSTSQ